MHRIIATAALVATTLAAPALADDQLARSLGVEPGAYSLTELSLLRQAREDGDRQRERLILDDGGVAARLDPVFTTDVGAVGAAPSARE